ncbi:MAG: hypothetical protein ACTMKY_02985 [Dermabacteraceae bacterium]
MTSYDHLIVGCDQVADDAARALREHGATGSIGILRPDEDAPYTRPALTKKLWIDPEFGEDAVPQGAAEVTGADPSSRRASPGPDLARQAGLGISDGVAADEHLRTVDAAIWAAGDTIEHPDAILGRTGIEPVDHVRGSGAQAPTTTPLLLLDGLRGVLGGRRNPRPLPRDARGPPRHLARRHLLSR